MNQNKPKQIIVVRRDLHMRRGKEIAQGSHASIKWLVDRVQNPDFLGWAAEESFSKAEREWLDDKWTKVTLQVHSEKELLDLHEAAKLAGVESHLIQDEGLTEFHNELTYTVLALGPDYSNIIDPLTQHLKLY